MLGWTRAMAIDQIAPGEGAILQVRGVAVALFHGNDGWRALSAACPHAGSLISEFLTDSGTVMCPSHGWEFRADDGQCTTLRAQRLRVYATRVENGFVYVKVRPVIAVFLTIFGGASADPPRIR
ncbi:MAG: Rieske (2Fe-2S) protein [Planctomycetes bacterium]|nr:Rieske (2Fe-2S) protein [Planctomycetota bacterium]